MPCVPVRSYVETHLTGFRQSKQSRILRAFRREPLRSLRLVFWAASRAPANRRLQPLSERLERIRHGHGLSGKIEFSCSHIQSRKPFCKKGLRVISLPLPWLSVDLKNARLSVSVKSAFTRYFHTFCPAGCPPLTATCFDTFERNLLCPATQASPTGPTGRTSHPTILMGAIWYRCPSKMSLRKAT